MALLGDIKIMMLKGEKGDKGDGVYDDTEIKAMIAQETQDREEEIAEMERNFLNYLYPVGSIYMTVGTVSPAVLFGGTWEQIEGKFLLASSTSHASGTTGGSETYNYTPAGSIGNTTLTIEQIPSHTHTVASAKAGTTANVSSGSQFSIEETTATTSSVGGGQSHTHTWTGTQTTFNNMPPYLSVNVWKRTA